ncbi:protein FAM3C isoform X2 [Echeneis naucrates]|uniref:protein FAM3C isoform X2 n=1 Tax=Echeneis naucrates TaxID=173247 RepID=UPI001113E6EC|nr:protein FAM3C-like isoform X2 [Echeneis naucrates]
MLFINLLFTTKQYPLLVDTLPYLTLQTRGTLCSSSQWVCEYLKPHRFYITKVNIFCLTRPTRSNCGNYRGVDSPQLLLLGSERSDVADMRYQAVLYHGAVMAFLLMTWIIVNNLSDQKKFVALSGRDKMKEKLQRAVVPQRPECNVSKVCLPDHVALHIRSGAANVVGPRICFAGKIIMSHVMNNVGPGLNIVVIEGESGVVEKAGYLNMRSGNPEDILSYLKEIKPGRIVLVASFDDVTEKMTDEMREIFVGMGSTLIKSVKQRDSWVFAGKAGTEHKSLFEKDGQRWWRSLAVSQKKHNQTD